MTSTPARGGAKAAVKPRVGLAGARSKGPAAKNSNGTANAAGAAAVVGVDEAHSDEPAENGDDLSASMYSEPPEAEVHDEEDTHEHVEEVGDMSHEAEDEGASHDIEAEEVSHEVDSEDHVDPEEVTEGPSIIVSPSPGLHEDLVEDHASEHEEHEDVRSQTGDDHDHEEHIEEDVEAEPLAQPGTDIDDIVNLLETKPNISISEPPPVSEEHIPEDAPDIPDEE